MPGLVRKGTEDEEEEKAVASDQKTVIKLNGKELTDEAYNNLTVGVVMQLAVEGDHQLRRKILVWERKGKKRDAVILPLVNWNS